MSPGQDDITLTFAGGAGTVTGSTYLMRANARLGWRTSVAEDGATISLSGTSPGQGGTQ